MSGSALRQFDRQLQRIANPQLVDLGFTPCPDRAFRRDVEHEGTSTAQLIEFQVGIKGSLVGRFTVNLGVYNEDLMLEMPHLEQGIPMVSNCMYDLTQRLGFFYIAEQPFLARLLRRPRHPSQDYWWSQSEDEAEMTQTMQSVASCLIDNGLSWLDSRTNTEAFKWAIRELQRRKEWKKQLTQPNAISTFEASPFPYDA